MEILEHLLLVTHLLGMAALVGGWLAVRTGSASAQPLVVWGARAQIVTGLLLVGILESGDETVNHAKVGVKLLVALGAAAAAEMSAAAAKRGDTKPRLVDAAGLLGVLNVAIAALW